MSTDAPSYFHLDRWAATIAAEGENGNPDDLLDTKQLAAWLKVSEQWCEIGRHRGYGPPAIWLSPRRCRYRRDSVILWLKEREFASTSARRAAQAEPADAA